MLCTDWSHQKTRIVESKIQQNSTNTEESSEAFIGVLKGEGEGKRGGKGKGMGDLRGREGKWDFGGGYDKESFKGERRYLLF